MAIAVLAGPGDNILVPSPGFPLYSVLADSTLVDCKHYNLIVNYCFQNLKKIIVFDMIFWSPYLHIQPERSWEVDLKQMESLIDSKTTLIVVNNPSNPCGSVWSSEHIMAIIKLAEKYQLPIVADEVYADFVSSPNKKSNRLL